MLIIRLARIGKTKQPTFRLVVSERKRDLRGNFLENLGVYNPRRKELKINEERIRYWLSKGAQLSATVHNLLVDQKIIEEAKRKKVSLSKKKKDQMAEKKKTETAAAAA